MLSLILLAVTVACLPPDMPPLDTLHSEGAAMTDDTATDWWLDRGLLTDDIPPRVQADPKPTCQFHRRGMGS